jgi:hypothetical protein
MVAPSFHKHKIGCVFNLVVLQLIENLLALGTNTMQIQSQVYMHQGICSQALPRSVKTASNTQKYLL